ncbi:MAG: DMT family transporter, partial [Gammaproteobacteria bacterium]|nr:DMT family transporter [Gammaproteobacteria bacterium]
MPSDRDDSHHAILGVGFKLASVFCLASMAACVKYVGASVPPGEVVFFRGLISMIVVVLVAWNTVGLAALKTRNLRAHAYRSLAGTFSMFCWFVSLTLIPLAQMTAISFTIPLFLTVLAMLFLNERIHAYRWTALGIGFGGVLVVVAPDLLSGEGSAFGIGIAFLAAILAAFALMFLRRMSGQEHAMAITFYFFLTSTVVALLSLIVAPWPMPTAEQLVVLGLVGLFGAAGQLTM